MTISLPDTTGPLIAWTSFSQITCSFEVTPDLMIKGLVFALVTGFFGGLSPALRASREKTAGILRGM